MRRVPMALATVITVVGLSGGGVVGIRRKVCSFKTVAVGADTENSIRMMLSTLWHAKICFARLKRNQNALHNDQRDKQKRIGQ